MGSSVADPAETETHLPTFDELCEEIERNLDRVARFNAQWIALSRMGYCDALGSAEYERLYQGWVDDGCDRLIGIVILTLGGREH